MWGSPRMHFPPTYKECIDYIVRAAGETGRREEALRGIQYQLVDRQRLARARR